jgi:hypothetical protein
MISPADLIVKVALVAAALLFLCAIGLIGYIAISLVYQGYPNIASIGHSEPYEEYMKSYIHDLVKTIKYIVHGDILHANDDVRKVCTKFANQISNANADIKLVGDINTIFAEQDCTPDNYPCLYMYFIFKEAIQGLELKSELVLYKQFFGQNKYGEGIDSTDPLVHEQRIALIKQDVDTIDMFFSEIQSIVDKKVRLAQLQKVTVYDGTSNPFVKKKTLSEVLATAPKCKLFSKVASLPSAPVSKPVNITPQEDSVKKQHPIDIDVWSMRLAVLASYRSNIFKAYDYRKSKGTGNMKLFMLLMRDYVQFVFGDILPRIWRTTWQDIKATEAFINKFVKDSESFVKNLPFIIAGIKGKGQEDFVQPPFSKRGDVVEHLGFLKGLLEIPKFFKILIDLARALAQAVLNPIKAFRIFIGLVVGVCLYICYILISTLSFLFIIPAAYYTVLFKVYMSSWWINLFMIVAVFYLVVWVINQITNGMLASYMRCENLPTSWFKQAGFMYGNAYYRSFFCNVPCATKYQPTGIWCTRQKKHMPSYCPQQLIYQGFELLLDSKEQSYIPTDILVPSFNPDPQFYMMSQDEQHNYIKDILKDKVKHMHHCFNATADFIALHRLIKGADGFHGRHKQWPEELLYNYATLSVCDFIKYLEDNKEKAQIKELLEQKSKLIDQLRFLCQETYCNFQYTKGSTAESWNQYIGLKKKKWGTTMLHPAYSFCEREDNTKEDDVMNTSSFEKISVMQKLLLLCLFVILLVITFTVIMVVSSEAQRDAIIKQISQVAW